MFTTYYLLVYIPTLAGLFGTLIWPIRKKSKWILSSRVIYLFGVRLAEFSLVPWDTVEPRQLKPAKGNENWFERRG